MPRNAAPADERQSADVKAKILDTASLLFYTRGARAVGVDLVVAEAGVAKTSLYRHFGTKDDLIAAFLEREDKDFWSGWDEVAERHPDDAAAGLDALFGWIGERLERDSYRGCPQINVAAEFPEADHPARRIAAAHKREMRQRLKVIAERLGATRPDELAGQLALLINGAFVSASMLDRGEPIPLLKRTARALVEASRR